MNKYEITTHNEEVLKRTEENGKRVEYTRIRKPNDKVSIIFKEIEEKNGEIIIEVFPIKDDFEKIDEKVVEKTKINKKEKNEIIEELLKKIDIIPRANKQNGIKNKMKLKENFSTKDITKIMQKVYEKRIKKFKKLSTPTKGNKPDLFEDIVRLLTIIAENQLKEFNENNRIILHPHNKSVRRIPKKPSKKSKK